MSAGDRRAPAPESWWQRLQSTIRRQRLRSTIWPSRAPRLDPEVEEEIGFHIEMRTAANVAAGMEPDAARRDAERRFGARETVRAAGRESLQDGRSSSSSSVATPHRRRWSSRVEGFVGDVRFSVRDLRRNRLATAAAVLSLGLGIGANTANFSVVYGILFRELPFVDADRLLFVDAWNPDRGDGDAPLTWADIEHMRQLQVFDQVGAYTGRNFTVTGGDRPERVAGAAVTPELFDLLGVQPDLGRTFRPEEGAEAGFEPVAIISDALWNRTYAADPDIVGKTIRLNGRELVIIGVMPAGFRFPELQDLWLPLGTNDPTDHQRRFLLGVAKLALGVSLAAASDQLDLWAEGAAREYPRTHEGWDVRAQWFRFGFVDAAGRQGLYLLLASVGFVLLLACANVANLLLARSTDLYRDLVVRSALGASRLRLARQMLTESVLLGLAGGVLGVVVARVWIDLMAASIPEEMAFWIHIAVDRSAFVYTALIAVGTGLLFGLLPALQASRAALDGINAAGRGVVGDRSAGRWRSALVCGEVALSVVLLASATLMVRSFLELQAADPGFDDSRLLSMRIVQAGDRYDDPQVRAQYFLQAAQRLAELPGVEAAVATSAIPADDGGGAVSLLPDGASETEQFYATAMFSTPGLFETLGIAPLAGRDFTVAEAVDPEARVAIVGARLAQRLWPEGNPLEQELRFPTAGAFRVVGVAPDLQYEEFGEEGAATRLQVHLPYAIGGARGMAFLVHASGGDPAGLTAAVRDELTRLDPTLAPFDIMTMRDRRAFTTWPQRLFGNSFAAFGLIAFVLALFGIYSVIAYAVVRRTREIGVRVALGARSRDVLGSVVGHAVRLAAIGAAVGLVGAVVFARALGGVLYGVSTTDPALYASVVGIIIGAAALASYLPARRAAAIDPTEALRAE